MDDQRTKLFLTGILLLGTVGLLKTQSTFSLPTSQAQPKVSENDLYPYHRGSWTGNLQQVGSQGLILLFIDSAGKLHGSYESKDGLHFAQISGHHRGNDFHMAFKAPPGALTQARAPLNATAKWEGVNRFYLYDSSKTGHASTYMFERPRYYLPKRKSNSRDQ